MVDREGAKLFLNQFVQIERLIDGKAFLSKGKVVDVFENDLVLEFNNRIQIYDLNSITSIRVIT